MKSFKRICSYFVLAVLSLAHSLNLGGSSAKPLVKNNLNEQLVSKATVDDKVVLAPSDAIINGEQVQLAAHYSHRSHQSHKSHYSARY